MSDAGIFDVSSLISAAYYLFAYNDISSHADSSPITDVPSTTSDASPSNPAPVDNWEEEADKEQATEGSYSHICFYRGYPFLPYLTLFITSIGGSHNGL